MLNSKQKQSIYSQLTLFGTYNKKFQFKAIGMLSDERNGFNIDYILLDDRCLDLFELDLVENELTLKNSLKNLIINGFDNFISEIFNVFDPDIELDMITQFFPDADTSQLTETMFDSFNFEMLKDILYEKYMPNVVRNPKVYNIIKKVPNVKIK